MMELRSPYWNKFTKHEQIFSFLLNYCEYYTILLLPLLLSAQGSGKQSALREEPCGRTYLHLLSDKFLIGKHNKI